MWTISFLSLPETLLNYKLKTYPNDVSPFGKWDLTAHTELTLQVLWCLLNHDYFRQLRLTCPVTFITKLVRGWTKYLAITIMFAFLHCLNIILFTSLDFIIYYISESTIQYYDWFYSFIFCVPPVHSKVFFQREVTTMLQWTMDNTKWFL